jgi:hypothetical protein
VGFGRFFRPTGGPFRLAAARRSTFPALRARQDTAGKSTTSAQHWGRRQARSCAPDEGGRSRSERMCSWFGSRGSLELPPTLAKSVSSSCNNSRLEKL